jgi:glycosyltransferase involved in cell wall biosynthesis
MKAGWQVELYQPDAVSVGVENRTMKLKGINPEGLDLVVMQRIMSPMQVRLIQAFQDLGIAVVVDVDDAVWRIEPDNSASKRWNQVVGGKRRFEHLDAACALADLVTVSTPALAPRYGNHDRVRVIRNGLPGHAYAKKAGPLDRPVRIGWAGSLSSHPNDLQIMGSAVADVIRHNDDVTLHIVGDMEPVADLLGVPHDRATGTGWLPIDQYHEALREIDVMFVPLKDTYFNRAKSALKVQEAAAAGCVVVASATPENRRLFERGEYMGGMLEADDDQHWGWALNRGIKDARAGRCDPESVRNLSYRRRWQEWTDAWKAAVQRRKLATK